MPSKLPEISAAVTKSIHISCILTSSRATSQARRRFELWTSNFLHSYRTLWVINELFSYWLPITVSVIVVVVQPLDSKSDFHCRWYWLHPNLLQVCCSTRLLKSIQYNLEAKQVIIHFRMIAYTCIAFFLELCSDEIEQALSRNQRRVFNALDLFETITRIPRQYATGEALNDDKHKVRPWANALWQDLDDRLCFEAGVGKGACSCSQYRIGGHEVPPLRWWFDRWINAFWRFLKFLWTHSIFLFFLFYFF
jgi:hypothetical protein